MLYLIHQLSDRIEYDFSILIVTTKQTRGCNYENRRLNRRMSLLLRMSIDYNGRTEQTKTVKYQKMSKCQFSTIKCECDRIIHNATSFRNGKKRLSAL